MNQVADYYGEQLLVGAVDREKIRRHRFTLPLFRQERFNLAIRELNRVWKKRCVSFNSKNKESGGDSLTETVNCVRLLTKGVWGLRNMPILTRTRSALDFSISPRLLNTGGDVYGAKLSERPP
ncbi:hypothetical protein ES708_22817 [subsurface metagenome]